MTRHRQTSRLTNDDRVLALDHVALAREVDPRSRLALRGTLGIPRNAGRVESFHIKVLYPADDPIELPEIYDPAGRFPPHPQRHIEPDGRFCLWLPELAPYDAFSRPTGLALLLARVQEFLELQMQYESRLKLGLPNPWPGHDWDHGDAARRQWLRRELDVLGHQRLARLVAAADHPPKRNARCPCGSRQPTRTCHQRMITGMRQAWYRDPAGRNAAHQFLETYRALR